MANSYGIRYCEHVLSKLSEIEEELFETTGEGFGYFSEEYIAEREYKRLLKKFRRERELGLQPSYDPSYHGTF